MDGHAGLCEGIKNAYVVYSEKLKGRDHWEVLDVDVRIIL
jgi:hypothetical protein